MLADNYLSNFTLLPVIISGAIVKFCLNSACTSIHDSPVSNFGKYFFWPTKNPCIFCPISIFQDPPSGFSIPYSSRTNISDQKGQSVVLQNFLEIPLTWLVCTWGQQVLTYFVIFLFSNSIMGLNARLFQYNIESEIRWLPPFSQSLPVCKSPPPF